MIAVIWILGDGIWDRSEPKFCGKIGMSLDLIRSTLLDLRGLLVLQILAGILTWMGH